MITKISIVVLSYLAQQVSLMGMPGMHPALLSRVTFDWMPSRINSLYSDVGVWSGKIRPVMDELESDDAFRYTHFLNYLDGGSFGTGPLNEFIQGYTLLAQKMETINSKASNERGRREIEALYGTYGVSLRPVLGTSTIITKRRRKYFCTGEVKIPIVDGKVICKDRIILPLLGTACRDAVMLWAPHFTEEKYCVEGLEYGEVRITHGEMVCLGDIYSKRDFLLACEFYEDQEAPSAELVEYYADQLPSADLKNKFRS